MSEELKKAMAAAEKGALHEGYMHPVAYPSGVGPVTMPIIRAIVKELESQATEIESLKVELEQLKGR